MGYDKNYEWRNVTVTEGLIAKFPNFLLIIYAFVIWQVIDICWKVYKFVKFEQRKDVSKNYKRVMSGMPDFLPRQMSSISFVFCGIVLLHNSISKLLLHVGITFVLYIFHVLYIHQKRVCPTVSEQFLDYWKISLLIIMYASLQHAITEKFPSWQVFFMAGVFLFDTSTRFEKVMFRQDWKNIFHLLCLGGLGWSQIAQTCSQPFSYDVFYKVLQVTLSAILFFQYAKVGKVLNAYLKHTLVIIEYNKLALKNHSTQPSVFEHSLPKLITDMTYEPAKNAAIATVDKAISNSDVGRYQAPIVSEIIQDSVTKIYLHYEDVNIWAYWTEVQCLLCLLIF